MSSSEASSDSELKIKKMKKVVRADSDDSEPKKTNWRSPRGNAKTTVIESDEDSDDDDNQMPSSSRKRKQASPAKKQQKKRKARGESSESEHNFAHPGLDLNAEEKKRLSKMSEKEREEIIFYRMEELEMKKAREQIELKMFGKGAQNAAKATSDSDESDSERRQKKGAYRSDSDDEQAKPKTKSKKAKSDSDSEFNSEFQRPSELAKKQQQKNAMSELLNRRREKEKKDAKKAALAVDAVFGKDRGSDDESESSSSSSSASSRSSSPSSRSSRARSASPDEDDKPKRPVECMADLDKARLSRYRMSKFVHAPFFKKAVVGCFVRVSGGGPPPAPGVEPNAKIGQILDVVESPKTYSIEGKKTNKALKLRIGGREERNIRLEFISSQPFKDKEFSDWVVSMKFHSTPLPTMDHIEKKQKDIKSADSHVYTDAEVEAMVVEKKRFEQKTGNFAARKRQLLTEKERAEQTGDLKAVTTIQQQIQEIDEHADRLDRQRQGDIVGVSWINKRNRQQMVDALLGDNKYVDLRIEDDPFTRKSGRMKPVSGSSKDKRAENAAAKANLANPGTPATPDGSAATPVLSTPSSTSGTPKLPSTPVVAPNLYDLHQVEINLDDFDLGKLTAKPHDVGIASRPTPSASESTIPRGRPMSVEDYKRRKQMLLAQKGQ